MSWPLDYTIAGIDFDKGNDARMQRHVKDILDKQIIKTDKAILSGHDFEFMKELFGGYSKEGIKNKGKIDNIYVIEEQDDDNLRVERFFLVKYTNAKRSRRYKGIETIDIVYQSLL